MKTIYDADALDIDIDAPDPQYELTEHEREIEQALEAVRRVTRNAWEDDPSDHRTGCVTSILKAVADVLVNERGWNRRVVADALVLEAIRASGCLERKARP